MNKSFQDIALYGMSATPFTADLDQFHLEKYFGAIIDAKSEYVTPDIKIISYMQDYTFESFPELRDKLVDDEERLNCQISELRSLYKERHSIVVLTDRVQEAQNFYDRMAK